MDILGTVLNIIYPIIFIGTVVSGILVLSYIISYLYGKLTEDNAYFNDDGTYFEISSLFKTIKFLNNLLEDDKIKVSFEIVPNRIIFKDIDESQIPNNIKYILDRESVIIRILKYDNVATNILFNKWALLNNIYFYYFKMKLKRRSVIE